MNAKNHEIIAESCCGCCCGSGKKDGKNGDKTEK